MTLGEKIASLRNSHKMSQGDLAEKINVSRQSVSKWETGASVPELDKLILISALFNITLDELVKDDSVPEAAPEEAMESHAKTCVIQEKPQNTRRIIGFILFAAGLAGSVLGFVFSEGLLIFSLCLIIYGIICLAAKKYIFIALGWFSALLIYIPVWITGGRLRNIGAGFTVGNMVICLFLILAVIMTVVTFKAFKNRKGE